MLDKDNVPMALCPLIDDYITAVECMENQDIRDEYIPEKFKVKKGWRQICNNCKYQYY